MVHPALCVEEVAAWVALTPLKRAGYFIARSMGIQPRDVRVLCSTCMREC